jgi:uncharacterized lipoprotein YajG
MKKLAIMLSMLLVAAVASAQTTTQKTEPVKPAKSAEMKTHVVEAEVVSADAKANTLTIKGDPENKVLKVDAVAATHLMHLKAGEKVKLTCRDNEKGEHEAITKITVETAPAATKK